MPLLPREMEAILSRIPLEHSYQLGQKTLINIILYFIMWACEECNNSCSPGASNWELVGSTMENWRNFVFNFVENHGIR